MTLHGVDISNCVEWGGAANADGHGRVWQGDHVEYVYRVAYTKAHGPIPDGEVIHHLCHNPRCYNPDHLVSMTRGEHKIEHGLTGAALTNSQREVCAWGHPFDGHNGKQRTCTQCRRRISREYMRRRRAEGRVR